ncbi:MAG: SAM-dependent methyltransferase [Candidatus Symbiothrix sp.]|jgi:16S rRNA (cytidine1402-2'-O)-methyltransferase|nr:SAM-dependent methyltransferase [Candidatus Symbiothrix sp.]
MSQLFLIPVTLGETPVSKVLPAYNREVILSLRHFIVENVRTARRFLKQTEADINIDDLTFFTLNKHTSREELSGFLQPISEGFSMGLLSEAGCPAIADPGADVVALAQQKRIPVRPLVGPSSILLSLMASGFNGQNFAFLGYLPIDSEQRIKTLKTLEQRTISTNQTQIFIETPYRNKALAETILKTAKPSTRFCIAADITLETEWIQTRSIADWKKTKLPDLSKKPCIFLLGK